MTAPLAHLKKLGRRLLRADAIRYQGLTLPPYEMRTGGRYFAADADFVAGARTKRTG